MKGFCKVSVNFQASGVFERGERKLRRLIDENPNADYILFKTGLRISEFVGLVFDNIDFENERIIVNHQLQRTPKMKYIIVEPKTESGFLFLDKNNMPMVAMHWEKYFQHICEKYNKIYKEEMHRVIKQAAETTRKSVAESVS